MPVRCFPPDAAGGRGKPRENRREYPRLAFFTGVGDNAAKGVTVPLFGRRDCVGRLACPSYHRNSRRDDHVTPLRAPTSAARGSHRILCRRLDVVLGRGRPQGRLDSGPDCGGRIRTRRRPGPAGGRPPATRRLVGGNCRRPGPARRPRRLVPLGRGDRRRPRAGRDAFDRRGRPLGRTGRRQRARLRIAHRTDQDHRGADELG